MAEHEFGFLLKKNHTCDVCNEPLSAFVTPAQSAKDLRVCRSFECQNIIKKRTTMSAYAFKCFFDYHRSRIAKRQHFIVEEKQRVADLESKHDEEHQLILDEVLATHLNLSVDHIQLVEIPSGLTKTSPLDSERLKRYTDYLRDLLDQAKEYASVKNVPFDDQLELNKKRMAVDSRLQEGPKEKEISEALCGMCKGGCCPQGKDTAYLSVLTVRRYMDAHPAQSVQDVLNSYLSLLSDTPITNSCINQTSKGCGLSRDMRSDLCNGYFCDSIVAYQKQAKSSLKSPSVLAIQRANTNWNRLDRDVDKHVVDKKIFNFDS
ncbi:MAG: hypothetical protein ACI9T7_001888 [Oleiphilaceae bacterium]|jgi:hypothetical protein